MRNSQPKCPTCGGDGFLIKEIDVQCEDCGGTGVYRSKQTGPQILSKEEVRKMAAVALTMGEIRRADEKHRP